MSNEGDGLSLVFLKAKKNMAFNFQSQKYLPHSICESIKLFHYMTQGKYMNTTGEFGAISEHGGGCD
jgi:hypothetical protein